MSFEGLDASPALGAGAGVSAAGGDELPHLDRPVQTARHEISPVRRKCYRVHRVLVAVRTFKTLNEVAVGSIPHANALVERPSSNVLGIGRDGHSGDTVLNAKGQDVLARFNVPEADSAVTASRCNSTPVTSEVKRVDILLVTSEAVSDGAGSDIPDLTLLARSTTEQG